VTPCRYRTLMRQPALDPDSTRGVTQRVLVAASPWHPFGQGLTLLHFSAQRQHFLWDTWLPPVDIWVITGHKLHTKRLGSQEQNGVG
jgi:hypothetical protein